MRKTTAAAAALMLTLLACLAPEGRAQESKRPQHLMNAVQATVRIIAGALDAQGEFRGQGTGSGVIVSPDGLVVTDYHVIARADAGPYPEVWAGLVDPRHEYSPPNKAVRLKLLSSSPELDLAVLRIVSNSPAPVTYPYLRFAPSLTLSYGSTLSLVGFPVAGGTTVTVTRLDVVGLDDSQGWVKVDGAMMRGASGGAVVNAEGGLIGIPAKVQVDQAVPFFGDEGLPHGTVTLGTVGFVRSSEVVLKFLSDNSLMAGTGLAALPAAGLRVKGQVTDKDTGRPVGGAVVGLLAPNALTQSAYVSSQELMAYAKSDGAGGFDLNRPVRSGKYLIKIVHPKYKTLVTEIVIDPNNTEFDVELVRE